MSLRDDAESRSASMDESGALLEKPNEIVKGDRRTTYGQKFKYIIYVYLVTLSLGAFFAITPATFLDLMSHTKSEIDQGSLIFTLNSLGYTVGSLASGFLFDWCNKDLIYGGSAIMAGIFMMLVPVSDMFPMVAALLFISNIFQGTMDNGSTLLCVITWGDDANSYQQADTLFFALGGIIAPLVSEPFLLKTAEEGSNMSTLNTAFLNLTTPMFETSQYSNSKLVVPFIIVAVICILSSLPFIAIFIQTKLAPVVQTSTENLKEAIKENKKMKRMYLIAACALLAPFFMASGYILGLSEFSMPFLVDYLGWSKSDGARLNSVLWAAVAAGCFVGIFLAKMLRPALMVIVSIIPITCGLVGLVVGAETKIVVWISYFIVFLGHGLLYPSMVTWVDQHLIRINGRICSLFTISSCVGEMTNAMLLGNLFKYHSPMWLIYLTLGSAVVIWITLVILFCTRRRLSKHISPELYNNELIIN